MPPFGGENAAAAALGGRVAAAARVARAGNQSHRSAAAAESPRSRDLDRLADRFGGPRRGETEAYDPAPLTASGVAAGTPSG